MGGRANLRTKPNLLLVSFRDLLLLAPLPRTLRKQEAFERG